MPPLPILPQPAQVEHCEGQVNVLARTPVVAVGGHPEALKVASQFVAMVAETHGVTLPQSDSIAPHTISLHLAAAAELPRESYTLEVAPNGIALRASDAAGLYYAAVTLWQLLTSEIQTPAAAAGFGEAAPSATHAAQGKVCEFPITLPALRIEDAPRFRWRGFMLDSARHIQPVEQIKRLIDQAARHKLNTFHWHLTEDQGWRLEIKRYPLLTEVGAWRKPAGKAGSGPDGQPRRYGGFYTQDEARELVAYAAERHITIVPEIEMPGHSRAALAAYPELGCTESRTEVSPNWGIHTWLFGVSDQVFEFLENVLREVFDIFPGSYIHIGGDEAAKAKWKKSPQVQAKMRELGLADEGQMQSWFIRRIAQFISAQGRKLIGWDEILEGGPLPEGANVMVWHEIKNAAVAARAGHDVVMTPTAYTYLNRAQSLAHDEPPGHDCMTSLQKVYEFEPVPAEVPAEAVPHIIGYQANLWTEYVRTAQQVEHMFYPRLSAVAENAWSPAARRDWQGFLPRIVTQLRRLQHAGIRAADSAFAVQIEAQASGPGVSASSIVAARQALVQLSNQAGFGQLRYTLDGSEPSADSPLYSTPITIELPATISANAFYEGRAIARTRHAQIDSLALRTRTAEQLVPSPEGSWRFEDDEPFEGERLVVLAHLGTPQWIWEKAPLNGIRSLRIEAIDLPYNFEFGDSGEDYQFRPATEPIYLQLYLGSFDGEPVAQALVDAKAASAIKLIELPLPEGLSGTQDLYLKFTGSEFAPIDRETFWTIYRLQLRSAAESAQ